MQNKKCLCTCHDVEKMESRPPHKIEIKFQLAEMDEERMDMLLDEAFKSFQWDRDA